MNEIESESFNGLGNVEVLSLHGDSFTILRADMFQGLSAVKVLRVY